MTWPELAIVAEAAVRIADVANRKLDVSAADTIVQAVGEVGHEMGLLAVATGLVPDDTTIAEAIDAALTRIEAARAKPRRPLLPRLELGPHGPAWLSLLCLCGWMAGVVEWDGVEPFRGVAS